MEETMDWEKRDETTPFYVHMIAGCCAGILEHATMLPLDNVKVTHLQVVPNQSIPSAFREIGYFLHLHRNIFYRRNGPRFFFSGLTPIASGCMPAHACYFTSYELGQDILDVKDENHHPVQFIFIGAVATLFHDLILTPFDVIKQRQQMVPMRTKRVLKMLIKQEGFRQLYRSFPITYFMNAPNQAIIISANESLKRIIAPIKDHTFMSYFVSAGLAGALAALFSNPMDVIKTKLQTQNYYQENCCREDIICNLKQCQRGEEKEIKYRNISSTIKIVMKEQGIKGFYRGLGPRLVMQTPSSAIAWSSYEMIKKVFQNEHPE